MAIFVSILVFIFPCGASTKLALHLADIDRVRFGVSVNGRSLEKKVSDAIEHAIRERGGQLLKAAGVETGAADEVYLQVSIRFQESDSDDFCAIASVAAYLLEPVDLRRESQSGQTVKARTWEEAYVLVDSSMEALRNRALELSISLTEDFIGARHAAQIYISQHQKASTPE